MKENAIRQFVRKELRAAVTMGVATAIGIGGGLPAARATGLTGGTVVSGQGSITNPNATTTLINQQSNQLTLNWSTFNVAGNETVRFVQPSSSSVALNNILSQSPSQIFGEIDANGRVILINPNGILFGRTAQLNVGSLIASSLELKQFDPATGSLSFQSLSGRPGAIVNDGTITAGPGGSVVLLGGTVLNNGLVLADYGTVAMGAGNVATLDFYGGGLLRVQVSGDVNTNPTGAAAAVQNNGQIQANGGQVVLTAAATQGVFASAVDNAGVIRAARVKNVGGVIELLGTDGAASNSGTLDASGADATSTGGTVTVTGNSVSLSSTARVDVSGAAGGGTASIGGGLHGADTSIPNASSTSVASGATIDADATDSGNGGTIAVWSDGTTTAQGTLTANGGPGGGNGGMIETSGHDLNSTGATVRAGAPAGSAGEWLLDPFDVTIDHSTTAGSTISGGNNGTNATVDDFDINAALKGTGVGDGTNVTIETSQPAASAPTSTGAITFGSGVSITNADDVAHTLTLDADTSIDLTAATAPSITSGTGALNLILAANANGQAQTPSTAGVTLTGTINVNDLTVTATGPVTQSGGTIKASGNLSVTAGGTISQAAAAGIQLTGTAGTNTATFTVTGAAVDVNLGGTANNFNAEATTITKSGTGAAVGNVSVADTNATFVPLTLPTTLTSLVLSDPTANAQIAIPAETLTGVGAGTNLAGTGATLDVTAGGAITQAGTLSVTGTTSLTATGNNITLGNAANTFTGNVAFAGAAVTLTGAGALSTSGTASGNLIETAGGKISEGTAGIQLGGTAGTNTASFTVTSATANTFDVDLGGSTLNNFNDEGTTITNAGSATVGNVRVADTNATFVPLTLPTTLTSLVLSDPTANAQIAIPAETLTGVGAGTNLAGTGATLDVVAGGAITQAGTLSVTGTTSLTATGNNITLGNTANTFTGNVAFAGAAVTLTSAGALSTSGTASGNLIETAGGKISEGTAGIQLGGTAGTNTARFTVTSATANTFDVDLGGSTLNNFNDEGTTIANAGSATVGNVRVADTNATFVPLTLPTTLTSLVLSDPTANALIAIPAETLTGVGAGTNLAGTGTTLDVTAGGAIQQAGALSVTGTTGLNAGGAITLSNTGNALNGAVTLTGGAVTLANTTAITLAGTDSAGSLTLDAGNSVAFGTAAADSTTVTNGLIVQGLAGSGTATGGAVTQVGTLGVGTTTLIDAGTNDITLSNAGNAFVGNVTLTGGAVTLANNDATTLAGFNNEGSLTLDAGGAVIFGTAVADATETTNGLIIRGLNGTGAAGGAVTEPDGKVVVGTTTSIDTGTNAITLGNAPNAFIGNVTLIGGAVTLANANATTLAGATSVGSLTLDAGNSVTFGALNTDSTTVTNGLIIQGGGGSGAAGGTVSQVGTLSVGGTSNIDANGHAIALGNSGNNLGGNVVFNANAVTLASAGALSSSGTTTGNLSETAGGKISEGAAGIQLAGIPGTNTATFTVTGTTHDVDLGNALNNFNDEATTVSASGTGAVGNVRVVDTNATFVPLTLPGTLTSLVLGDTTANAQIALPAATLTGVGAGTNLAGTATTLNVTAGGTITQSGVLSVTGTTSLTANSGASNITLNTPNNSFSGNVDFHGATVTLMSVSPLSSSGKASGNLVETAGGTISEGAAGIQLTGTAGTNTATFTVTGATHDVDLGSALNNFNDEATSIGGTVGNVRVVDTNPTFVPLTLPGTLTSLVLGDSTANAQITLPAATLTGVGGGTNLAGTSSTLDVIAGGSIAQTGALAVTGTTSLTAGGAINLTSATNSFSGNVAFAGTAVTLVSGGPLSSSGTASGNLHETAGGTVSQGGALSVGGTTSIGAGANDIDLSNSGNTLAGPVTFTGGAVTLANADPTTVAGADSASSLTLDAGGAVTFGTLSTDATTVANGLIVQGLTGGGAAGGAVTQVGTLTVGGTSNIDAGGNAVTLGNAGNRFGGNVGFAGGAVTLANAGALSTSGKASGNLIETAGGKISEGTAGIQLSGAGTATFTVTGAPGATYDVDLGGSSSNNFNDETTTITSSGGAAVGNVRVADTNAAFVPLVIPATLPSLVLSDPNAPIVLAGETLTGLGGGMNLAGGSTTLDVTAGGAITQSGVLSVTGTTGLRSGGAITLANAGNAFGSNVAFTGAAVTLANAGALSTSGSASGNLIETAGGAVSQQGGALSVGGTTAINAGTNAITLANSANAFVGPVTLTGGAVTLVNSDATTLAGTNSANALTLDAGGAVSETGTLSVATTTTINAGTNDITLGRANSFGGDVAFTGRTVALNTGSGDLMSSGTASGNLTETSAGAISQGGALNVAGSSTLTANGGSGNITLSNGGNAFAGSVTLRGSAVTLANLDTTTLAGTDSASSLTLDAGGGVTFGAAAADSTSVANGLIVQGVGGSGAAGGDVTENGTLSVGGTTSITSGAHDITLAQSNTFGGAVTFSGRNVLLNSGSGGLTTALGTASGNLTEIAHGSSGNLNVGTLTAGGYVLLIAGNSVLGTSSQATVNATNVEVRYALDNPNGQLGGTDPNQQIGFQAAPGASQVQLSVWLPSPGTQFTSADVRATPSDLLITKHPFVNGEQSGLYSPVFGLQLTGALAAIESRAEGTTTLGEIASGAATQGSQSVLVIDWASYNPNVSLFGTLNPAVCLPADQRDDSVGSGSGSGGGCAAASASLLKVPTPIQLAMVPTREGLKAVPLFYLVQ